MCFFAHQTQQTIKSRLRKLGKLLSKFPAVGLDLPFAVTRLLNAMAPMQAYHAKRDFKIFSSSETIQPGLEVIVTWVSPNNLCHSSICNGGLL